MKLAEEKAPKIKTAASQEERLHKWKEHFQNPTEKLFVGNLNQILIAYRERCDAVLKKIKNRKASTKYLLNYGRQWILTTYFFDYATLCINKTK